jgi:hypothetical protein
MGWQPSWSDAFHNSDGIFDTLVSLANQEPVGGVAQAVDRGSRSASRDQAYFSAFSLPLPIWTLVG